MGDRPIDVSSRPSMVTVRCDGGCGEWIVIDRNRPGGRCSTCLHAQIGGTAEAVVVPPPAAWSSEHNPPPPPAVYPPPRALPGRAGFDPALSARCLAHPTGDPSWVMPLPSLDPADVAAVFRIHDQLHHFQWIISGDGSQEGDICSMCGGGGPDKGVLVTELDGVEVRGPRHDLCLRGQRRAGWGRNCPCTHDKPWMRGVKPAMPGQPVITLPTPRPPAPEVVVIDIPTTGYLWDPEEEDPDV